MYYSMAVVMYLFRCKIHRLLISSQLQRISSSAVSDITDPSSDESEIKIESKGEMDEFMEGLVSASCWHCYTYSGVA